MRPRLVPLAALYAVALAPGFFAPFDPSDQFRDRPFQPPALRSQLHFFVQGAPYEIAGLIECKYHLVGFGSEPSFPLGTDSLGRDQLSRILHGAQISLFTAFLATLITLSLAAITGGVAGYFGGWVDSLLMRLAELSLVLPWLYLLIAIRAALPLHVGPLKAFVLLIVVIGAVGWARPAKLVRGVVLSARERSFVSVARGFGASDWYLLRRHVLPHTYGVIFTQAAILIPQYLLAEVALSFVGLGVAEPIPTLGNMLVPLRRYDIAVSYWWMYLPGFAVMVVLILHSAVTRNGVQRYRSGARLA